MFQMYADGYGQKTIAWTLNGNAAQRARAEEDGVQLHALAAFVVVLHPDDSARGVPVSCESIRAALRFIHDVKPRAVSVEVCESEDAAPLLALLERAGTSLH